MIKKREYNTVCGMKYFMKESKEKTKISKYFEKVYQSNDFSSLEKEIFVDDKEIILEKIMINQ